jgi:hypothetical protein
MDDSHPVASALELFFVDEDDAEGVRALTAQLGHQPVQARALQRAWSLVLAAKDAEAAVALVEQFANRDVGASGERALEWLAETYRKLDPLWKSTEG